MSWLLPRLVGAVALIACCASAAGAQRAHGKHAVMIDTGDRVRVGVTQDERLSPLTRHVQRVEGVVRRISPDTLYLEVIEGSPITAIPRARIQGVELSLGPPSRIISAKEIGGNIAILAGVIMALDTTERGGLKGAVVGAGAGFAAGALIGLVRPYERWQIAWIPE